MHPMVKSSLAVLAVSAVVIVWLAYSAAANESAWNALVEARAEGMSVEALEGALSDASGSDAEPWIAYHLAMALWDGGTSDELARARQVASEAIVRNGDHPTAPYLQDLVAAIDTYSP